MNKQDLTLLTDLYELTLMQGYYKKGANCTLYNLPMYSPAEVAALVDYWTHIKPRLKWM